MISTTTTTTTTTNALWNRQQCFTFMVFIILLLLNKFYTTIQFSCSGSSENNINNNNNKKMKKRGKKDDNYFGLDLSCPIIQNNATTTNVSYTTPSLFNTSSVCPKCTRNIEMTCEQLQRSLATWIQRPVPTVSLYRLAHHMMQENDNDNNNTVLLQVLVIGGSMTLGSDIPNPEQYRWTYQLEQLWKVNLLPSSNIAINVTNLARSGANEAYWLSHIHDVEGEHQPPPHVILVDSAVNDQCHEDEVQDKAKEVDENSYELLGRLMHLSFAPAVFSVEMFRYGKKGDETFQKAEMTRRCPKTQQITPGSGIPYCPSWYFPQTWRTRALQAHSVGIISYRDAVWPTEVAPYNLDNYWWGMSHPDVDSHKLVAETVLYAFWIVYKNHKQILSVGQKQQLPTLGTVFVPSNEFCTTPQIEKYQPDRIQDHPKPQGCWKFTSDKPNKYGWICEKEINKTKTAAAASTIKNMDRSLTLRIPLSVGGDYKVFVNRLVSYDERMADVIVSFDNKQQPTWKISSWHEQPTSIPVSYLIQLYPNGTTTTNTKLPTSVTMQMQLVPGSSQGHKNDEHYNGTEKFKLIDIVTC